MKKLFLLLLFVIPLPLSIEITATTHRDSDVVTIPINKGSDEYDENMPRSIITSDVLCIYSGSTFLFYFYNTFENVTIIVTNTTTGEQWSKSAYLPSCINITTSGSNGSYIISIYTETDFYSSQFLK